METYKLKLAFGELSIQICSVGNDYQVILGGGTRPHIGCTVLAVPRPSLTGSGACSSTASVLNFPGHKDEALCRLLAERLSAKKNAVVVCSGGFHMDGITKEQIQEVCQAVEQFVEAMQWFTEST